MAGRAVLDAAQDTVALFIGFELLSIPLYVLCATHMRREHSLESGLKYLIIGSVGSATLLYGLALIYGATGSTDYAGVAAAVGDLRDLGPRQPTGTLVTNPQREVSLIWYGNRGGLEDRVFRIKTERSGASTPEPRTAHMLSNIEILAERDGQVALIYSVRSPEEFAYMQEFQRLRDAPDDSPDGRRRMELDAEIKAYDASRGGGGGSGEQTGGGSGMPGRY